MRIVFMGTPDFAVPSLQRLVDDGHEVVAVYCQPDKPQGRHFTLTPPPVKVLAQQLGIEVLQPPTLKNEEAQQILAKFAPDIIAVAAYGKILPKAVLDMPKYGCINVHGSLLPKYRGAAPIQWAVINGEEKSGVTIMQMAEGLDTGDMLLVRDTEIGADETAGELFDRIAMLGAEALSEALVNIENLKAVPQDDALACWAPPLKKADGEINWQKKNTEIYSLIRGVSPWPGAYTIFGAKRLKIHKAVLCDKNGEAGALLDEARLIIGCGEGSVELLEVQLEGAKRISAADFIRGQRLSKGKIF
ncbi:MAG: methionyl-tRNA formyltransferase [Oscillospiraceae bacterium]|nr:methionyl-tRNA formyltransferase [Oscillospiraceae bacterium]MBQ4538838.1 methionyl-tRNA formyltransferase [Oscillospiraceae bacterium]